MSAMDRIACRTTGANTRSLLVRKKETQPHPVTKAPIVVKPSVFIQFPGTRSIFLDDRTVKMYGFKGVKDFFLWLKTLGEVSKGEIVYSFCIGASKRPVGDLGVKEVETEIRLRLGLPEKADLGMDRDECRSALLELRAIAGESVPEPRVKVVDDDGPSEEELESESDKITDRILSRHAVVK